jgi:5-methyltetrahydrofolate--homocysteine methyltransferase
VFGLPSSHTRNLSFSGTARHSQGMVNGAPATNAWAMGVGRPLLLDGAWGTELQAVGLTPGACPDVWNLDRPNQVQSVARRYLDAGSQIILTNTFGANRIALSRYGLTAQAAEINRAGVRLSRSAAAGQARVYASMGPCGKRLAMGDVSEAELMEAFTGQAHALADGGADGLVLETFTDLDELLIALQAARTTGLPVVACMVFDSGASKGLATPGTTPEKAAKALSDAGADVIGANCGHGVAGHVPICHRLRAATDRPIWIKPNAGLPTLVDGQMTYDMTPAQFAKGIMDLIGAGASMVGGCCGTNADFVKAMATTILQRLP